MEQNDKYLTLIDSDISKTHIGQAAIMLLERMRRSQTVLGQVYQLKHILALQGLHVIIKTCWEE